MGEVALAILWHQHQPYYPDDIAKENPMPWVRLHGVKDYWGMAMHLREVPEMRCTINLVPSLVHQILDYTDRQASDHFLDLSRIPANSLSREQVYFILDNFFMANPERMIRPYPRYAELYSKRNLGRSSAPEALRRFQERDLRDLQVWFNLAWVHPLAVQRDPFLKELIAKGRNFTEDEKRRLLDKHLELLKEIIPLHKELMERGQVELTTTPYYHPILPLILDKRLAREALPEIRLPRYQVGYPEDAEYHVAQAVAQHRAVFGRSPLGMWPAEGSVCQSMIPLLARHGIRWTATDEEILSQSTHGFVGRDSRGHVRNPDSMYRPYRVEEGNHALSIIFRDHALSDLIGFHYQRSDGKAAAHDFINKVLAIGRSVNSGTPALVSVILDGENCWEHYPGGGVDFLRELYHLATRTRGIHPTRVCDYLEQHPPRSRIPHLFAGSWINHNFDIWIGHEEDNTAWDLLHQTREHLVQRQKQGLVSPERAALAWREIYICEGSDWFWWYGPQHSSPQDGLFDYLFRKHLQNVYLVLGELPPPELGKPISKRSAARAIYTQPKSFLDVKPDGRRHPIRWMDAGHYVAQNERGTMALVTPGPIREIYFGFTPDRLIIRVDLDGHAASVLAAYSSLIIGFAEPPGFKLVIANPGRPSQQVELWRHGRLVPCQEIQVGVDEIVVVSIPFDCLEVAVDDPIHFFVELMEGTQSRDRAPRDATIGLTRPSPDFELKMWNAL
jgi:alpha-amylase/alpha-mannosidase (GH57 family)